MVGFHRENHSRRGGHLARAILFALLAGVCVYSQACGEDEGGQEKFRALKKTKSAPGGATNAAKNRLQKEKEVGSEGEKISARPLNETAFIPDVTRRDPFMPFVEVLVQKERVARVAQREVKLEEYDISDLRLIGIITNIGDPRAMVTTPDKTGFVLRRNDYVGRADFIKEGNDGEVIQVNWRVARIHGSGKEEERGIYLVRDDPTTTKGVDVTRFIPLHPVR